MRLAYLKSVTFRAVAGTKRAARGFSGGSISFRDVLRRIVVAVSEGKGLLLPAASSSTATFLPATTFTLFTRATTTPLALRFELIECHSAVVVSVELLEAGLDLIRILLSHWTVFEFLNRELAVTVLINSLEHFLGISPAAL